MSFSRREFLNILSAASVAGFSLRTPGVAASSKESSDPYELDEFGNVSITDLRIREVEFCHPRKTTNMLERSIGDRSPAEV